MHELPPASIHVRRHLTRRELATIAVALQLLKRSPMLTSDEPLLAQYCADDGLLSDDAIGALSHELTTARKVKVCRSKQKPA